MKDAQDINFNEECKIINKYNIINYYSKFIWINLELNRKYRYILFIFILIFLLFIKIKQNNYFDNNKINYINVAYSFDNDYHYICHVSMKSIMLSQKNNTFIKFYILVSSKFVNKQKNIIDKVCEEHNNCIIKYVSMNNDFKEFNISGLFKWSTAMFYRLKLQNILPQEKKILYLDCDTLIYKDLTEIYNYNIEDKYYTGMLEGRTLEDYGVKLNNFINTGVLLVNLENLRKDNVFPKIKEFLNKYNNKLLFPDQDTINGVCHEKNGYFPPKYVVWGFCAYNLIKNYINSLLIKVDLNKVIKAYKDPYIYHLMGYNGKPWNGITNDFGLVCYDQISRFYELARKTSYYYEILEHFKVYKECLKNNR